MAICIDNAGRLVPSAFIALWVYANDSEGMQTPR